MNHDEKPSKKSRPVTVEALLDGKRWKEARKRLKRIASPTRIGEILFHCADNPLVPYDIFESLLSKLKGKREKTYSREVGCRYSFAIELEFFSGVCNYYRERGYRKDFREVCRLQSATNLRLFLKEYADIVGKLTIETARETVRFMWHSYLAGRNPGRYFARNDCLKEREDGLLNVSSPEDLRSNEELHCLWEKTVLLIKLTKENWLDESVKKLPFVHQMIIVGIPKVVVWLAVRLFPDQVRLKDKMGRLPLHWAAANNNFDTEQDFGIKFQHDGKLSKVSNGRIVELILEFFPKGARCADKKGSLPLDLLLDLEYRSWTFNNWTYRCVLALMKQAPEALIKKNVMNRMLPFMTAACIHDENTIQADCKYDERRMQQRKLNLTYAILRANPSVVASGITETHEEQYLKQKLDGAQSTIQRLEEDKRKLQEEVTMLKKGKDDRSDESGQTQGRAKRSRV